MYVCLLGRHNSYPHLSSSQMAPGKRKVVRDMLRCQNKMEASSPTGPRTKASRGTLSVPVDVLQVLGSLTLMGPEGLFHSPPQALRASS